MEKHDNRHKPGEPLETHVSACSPHGADRIKLAVQDLPEATRRLFSLHFESDMTHAEIAEATGTPIDTLKTKLRRGLIAVRSSLRADTDHHT